MFFTKKPNLENTATPVVVAENKNDEIKDIIIQTMPERFREVGKPEKNNSTGLILLIGFAALLALGASIGYYYITNRKNIAKTPTNQEVEVPVETPKEVVPQVPSAKETFLKYNADFLALTDMGAYESFILNYGSPNRAAQYQTLRDKILTLSDTDKAQLLVSLKKGVIDSSGFKTVMETINNNEAVINIVTFDNQEASAVLILENNIWKMDKEFWPDASASNDIALLINNIVTASTTSATTTPEIENPNQIGLDTDKDGLTDKEEMILGTSLNNIDSDGDNYVDIDELNNGYNPAGAGKLNINKALASYKNFVYSYGLIYPGAWEMKKIDSDNSLIFLSTDGHFFQVVFQPNTTKQSIEEWYKEQFSVNDFVPGQIIAGTGWSGVKSIDGLNYFMTDDGLKNIIVLSYNIGSNASSNTGITKVMEYPNLFALFAKSFEFIKK